MATYSVPFNKIAGDQRFFQGIVTADVFLSWLKEIVSAVKIFQSGYAFLISQNGVFITIPAKRWSCAKACSAWPRPEGIRV